MARSYLISKLFLNKVALTGWALSAIEKLIENASACLQRRFISKAKKSRSEAKTWREMFNKFKSVFFLVVTLTKLAVGGKTTHFFSCCFFFFTPRRNKKTIFCSLPSSSLFHFRNVFVSRVAAGEKKNRAEDLRSWNQNRVLESLLDWYKQERLKSWSCQANYCCFEQNWHKQSLKFKMWFEEVFIWIRGASVFGSFHDKSFRFYYLIFAIDSLKQIEEQS